MQAISGDKAKDKSQGELQGVLKKMGYTTDQVMTLFPSRPTVVMPVSSWHTWSSKHFLITLRVVRITGVQVLGCVQTPFL